MKFSAPVSCNVIYHDASHLGTTSFGRFASALRYSLFDDIANLAKTLELEVLSCARRSELNSTFHVYPRLEWAAEAFSFEVKATFLSNFTFLPGVSLAGEVSGTFHTDTFKIGMEFSTDDKPMEHSKSMIPFLDTVLSKMQSLTGREQGKPAAIKVALKRGLKLRSRTSLSSRSPNSSYWNTHRIAP